MDRRPSEEPRVVNRLLVPLTESGDPNDPVKLWVILHYPDSLKLTVRKLKSLLDKLRSCSELYMYQFEWTLSARVNCKDDNPPPKVDCHEASQKTDYHGPQTLEKSCPCAEQESEGDFPLVTDYFCITAPVCNSSTVLDDETCPHYVVSYTETVIADLRYKPIDTLCMTDENGDDFCLSGNDVVNHFNKIADVVRTLVIETLISDVQKYRVYVLKPQHQGIQGVSPSASCTHMNIYDPDEVLDPIEPLKVPVTDAATGTDNQ